MRIMLNNKQRKNVNETTILFFCYISTCHAIKEREGEKKMNKEKKLT